MQEALDALRRETGQHKVDMAELVILGAQAKLRQVRQGRDDERAARERLASMIRGRTIPVDVEAADEAKRLGLPD